MNDRGMVIVGAGKCGTRAAFALREEGYVGPVTLIGAERHLPYERPPLSKEGMSMTGMGMKVIADAERLRTRRHTADAVHRKRSSIDRAAQCVELSAGGFMPYDKLLLATGAQPRRLPLAENSRHCAYLRTHDDAETIAERLRSQARIVIIGGGFIGLELAAAARQRGCAVTVLEMLPRLLARAVPAEIACVIAGGAPFPRRRHPLRRLTGGDRGYGRRRQRSRLATAPGSRPTLCIIGIGAVPDTDAGRARRAGDREWHPRRRPASRPTIHAIFAAGDCCSFPLALYGGRRVRLEAWRNAQDQGTLAARNMLGKAEAHVAVPWFWSDQYDLTLQVAGLVDEGVEASAAISAMTRSSSSISMLTAAWSRRAASAWAMRLPATSGLPKC